MTRARTINVGHAASRSVLAAYVAAAMAARPTPGMDVIENRGGQALPKGAQQAVYGGGKAQGKSKRAAANELVTVSNQTLVVSHLHPRWLRVEVERLMDGGKVVTHSMIDAMRLAGAEGARAAVSRLLEAGHG